MWLVGVKGLEICFYIFDASTFNDQVPECYDFLQLLNLESLSEPQLDQINAKYKHCRDGNFARIALIKWELDNPEHAPYIDHMFQFIRSRMP
jgi:hypothetical protein